MFVLNKNLAVLQLDCWEHGEPDGDAEIACRHLVSFGGNDSAKQPHLRAASRETQCRAVWSERQHVVRGDGGHTHTHAHTHKYTHTCTHTLTMLHRCVAYSLPASCTAVLVRRDT